MANPFTRPIAYKYKPLGFEAFATPLARKQAAYDQAISAYDDMSFDLPELPGDEEKVKAIENKLTNNLTDLRDQLTGTKDYRTAISKLKQLNKYYTSSDETQSYRSNYDSFQKYKEERRKMVEKGKLSEEDYKLEVGLTLGEFTNKGGTNYDSKTGDYNPINLVRSPHNMDEEIQKWAFKYAKANREDALAELATLADLGIDFDKEALLEIKTKGNSVEEIARATKAALMSSDRFREYLQTKADLQYRYNKLQDKDWSPELGKEKIKDFDEKLEALYDAVYDLKGDGQPANHIINMKKILGTDATDTAPEEVEKWEKDFIKKYGITPQEAVNTYEYYEKEKEKFIEDYPKNKEEIEHALFIENAYDTRMEQEAEAAGLIFARKEVDLSTLVQESGSDGSSSDKNLFTSDKPTSFSQASIEKLTDEDTLFSKIEKTENLIAAANEGTIVEYEDVLNNIGVDNNQNVNPTINTNNLPLGSNILYDLMDIGTDPYTYSDDEITEVIKEGNEYLVSIGKEGIFTEDEAYIWKDFNNMNSAEQKKFLERQNAVYESNPSLYNSQMQNILSAYDKVKSRDLSQEEMGEEFYKELNSYFGTVSTQKASDIFNRLEGSNTEQLSEFANSLSSISDNLNRLNNLEQLHSQMFGTYYTAEGSGRTLVNNLTQANMGLISAMTYRQILLDEGHDPSQGLLPINPDLYPNTKEQAYAGVVGTVFDLAYWAPQIRDKYRGENKSFGERVETLLGIQPYGEEDGSWVAFAEMEPLTIDEVIGYAGYSSLEEAIADGYDFQSTGRNAENFPDAADKAKPYKIAYTKELGRKLGIDDKMLEMAKINLEELPGLEKYIPIYNFFVTPEGAPSNTKELTLPELFDMHRSFSVLADPEKYRRQQPIYRYTGNEKISNYLGPQIGDTKNLFESWPLAIYDNWSDIPGFSNDGALEGTEINTTKNSYITPASFNGELLISVPIKYTNWIDADGNEQTTESGKTKQTTVYVRMPTGVENAGKMESIISGIEGDAKNQMIKGNVNSPFILSAAKLARFQERYPLNTLNKDFGDAVILEGGEEQKIWEMPIMGSQGGEGIDIQVIKTEADDGSYAYVLKIDSDYPSVESGYLLHSDGPNKGKAKTFSEPEEVAVYLSDQYLAPATVEPLFENENLEIGEKYKVIQKLDIEDTEHEWGSRGANYSGIVKRAEANNLTKNDRRKMIELATKVQENPNSVSSEDKAFLKKYIDAIEKQMEIEEEEGGAPGPSYGGTIRFDNRFGI